MFTTPYFLEKTNELIFKPLELVIKSFYLELECKEYNGCKLLLNDKKVLFRTAKTTPTKTGQFVTLWKRTTQGLIAPFEENDSFEFIIINCETATHFGQFVFPKDILIAQGIFSTKSKEGKRAFRVYPSWGKPSSKQAQKTQKWQLNFFVEIKNDHFIPSKFQELYF